MEDGYYLFVYIHIDEMSYLMQIGQRHDQNITLMKKRGKDIELVYHWEIERFTGVKHHDVAFYNADVAKYFINDLLDPLGISIKDLKAIIGTPQLDSSNSYLCHELLDKYTLHSICHLFGSILSDKALFETENIIGLALDGGSDSVSDKGANNKPFFVGCVSRKGNIDFFPVQSPGILWDEAKNIFLLEEGSLMALATSCELAIDFLDAFDILCFDAGCIKQVQEYVINLYNYAKQIVENSPQIMDLRFNKEENIISAVMKEIQKVSVNMVKNAIDDIREKYNLDMTKTYISMSGGYALNCPTNTFLINYFKFKGYIIPPYVNDGGQAIGLGLYYFWQHVSDFHFRFKNPFYGSTVLKSENFEIIWKEFIDNISVPNINEIVQDIIACPVVWLEGRSEIGPRALGGRSILADPRKIESKDMLNKVKERQWWRPVAPIILEDQIAEWYEEGFASPYMLHVFKLKKNKVAHVPAIAHIDGSSRVQTLGAKDNTLLYKVLLNFFHTTKVPMLCNTSLNDKGEPIINSLDQAMNFALRKGINIIYFDGKRVKLKNHERYKERKPLNRNSAFCCLSSEERSRKLKTLNPYGVDAEKYKTFRNLFPDMSINFLDKRHIRKMDIVNCLSKKV